MDTYGAAGRAEAGACPWEGCHLPEPAEQQGPKSVPVTGTQCADWRDQQDSGASVPLRSRAGRPTFPPCFPSPHPVKGKLSDRLLLSYLSRFLSPRRVSCLGDPVHPPSTSLLVQPLPASRSLLSRALTSALWKRQGRLYYTEPGTREMTVKTLKVTPLVTGQELSHPKPCDWSHGSPRCAA